MLLLILAGLPIPALPQGARATVAVRDRPAAAVAVREKPKATVQVTPEP